MALDDTRVSEIIAFANQAHEALQDRSSLPARQDLDSNIKRLHSFRPSKRGREFDRVGVDLWNVTNGILSSDDTPDVARIGVRARVFALLLLSAGLYASSRRSKDCDEKIRISKIALKASRLCLAQNELDLATTALEVCAGHLPSAEEPQPLMQISGAEQVAVTDRAHMIREANGELNILRMHQAWKAGRDDVIEFFYNKIDTSHFSAALALKTADSFYEISQTSPVRNDRVKEIEWLERAFSALSHLELDSLTPEAAEMRLTAGICLIDKLLHVDDDKSRHRADQVCKQLENTQCLSKRTTIPAARARLLMTERRPEPGQLSLVLSQTIKMAVLTEDSFAMIMQTLHQAAKSSQQTVLSVLKTFICGRLLPEIDESSNSSATLHDWIEKATVTYIHLATHSHVPAMAEMLDDMQGLFDSLHASHHSTFSTKATHAAQTLMWKTSDDQDRNLAYRWCDLLRHPLLGNAGHLNKARIGRRLMRLAMDDGNLPLAREAFFQMPPLAQNDVLSRYLSFRLALRSSDEELAMTSLDEVMKAAPKDPTYLYACVLDAQQSSVRRLTTTALQAILDQRPQGTNLPALLRCTVRLMASECRNVDDDQNQDAIANVVKTFERARKNIDDLRKSTQWRAEIQWWAKTTYNFAIAMCGHISQERLFHLLDICCAFLEAYPNDLGLMQQDDVLRRRMLCIFLSTTSLIVMGRTCEQANLEHAQQCYLHAQQQVETFRGLYDTLKTANVNPDELDSRAFIMLKFDLECVLQLKEWTKLEKTLQACLDAPGAGRWDALADLLIIVHRELDRPTQNSHAEMMTQLLQRMINDSWKKDKNIVKVTRWLRFTFTLCLDHQRGDFSLKLLQQAASMAAKGCHEKQDLYPESELKWITAASFNHAVDLLTKGRDDYVVWMDAALEVVKWSQDNGAQHAELTRKKALAVERASQMVKS